MSGKLRYLYAAGVLASALAITLFLSRPPNSIRGAVMTSDPNPIRELPIGDVEIGMPDRPSAGVIRSDATGFFAVVVPWHVRRGQPINLRFYHKDYLPLDLTCRANDQLCIAHLVSMTQLVPKPEQQPEITISNVVVQYSISTATSVNVGSAVKSFQAVNTGNVPCRSRRPCSPDGKWKAQEVSAVVDAGLGNEFRNARVSCIAGPCPFTKIEGNGISFTQAGRLARVSALNWSDTATFLFEAEVYRPMFSDVQRQLHPLVFNQALTFTLPPAAEGVSIQAELNGAMIVFPLGPALFLTWSKCQVLVNQDHTRVYRCELKPGYRFSMPEGS
ncbi:MAG TPA: hypothetical protein VMJ75_11500 [Candidatus Acidoferrales bacterium]|nr:hypothetical protein [Candidatus Acidoferrales bacterium]